MLVAAAGNTALQSVMPAIGREIGIADFYVAIAYTWSAVLWVALAPIWAEKSDHHGRKALTMMGVGGFIVSMTLCGIVLFAGLNGMDRRSADLRPVRHFPRASTAGLGCATPSATQAYLASKTRRSGRVAALSALSSSFGLGTIIGPARRAVVRASVRRPRRPAVRLRGDCAGRVRRRSCAGCPNDRYGRRVGPRRGDELSLAGHAADRRQRHRRNRAATPRAAEVERPAHPPVDRRGRRGRPCAGGDADLSRLLRHRPAAPAAVGLGRADRDRDDGRRRGDARRAMGPDPAPRPQPARADPVGRADRRGGPHRHDAVAATSTGSRIGFALASLGFGFTRPGFTAGASLAVPLAEQGAVAGVITSANGISYVLAPALGISLYWLDHDLPFAAFALLLVGLAWSAGSRLDRLAGPCRRARPQHAREGRSRCRPSAASPRSSASPGCAHIPRASRA